MSYKVLDLFTRGLAQGFCPAEVHGIRLHQVRIKLMLPDDLAEAIAKLGPAVVSVSGLGRKFSRLPLRLRRLGNKT
jgi:hypothetical protein